MRVDLGSKNGIRLGSHAHGFLTAMIHDWNACAYYHAVGNVRSLSKGRAQSGIYPYDEHFARSIVLPRAIISTLSGRVSGKNSDIRQSFFDDIEGFDRAKGSTIPKLGTRTNAYKKFGDRVEINDQRMNVDERY